MARGPGAALATLALLAFAGPSAAATPQHTSQKIFRDLADNGRLDAHYTDAQINRALYPLEARARYDVDSNRSKAKPTAAAPPSGAVGGLPSLPFSGLDLALFGGVGGPLILIGASLGRIARLKPHGEPG